MLDRIGHYRIVAELGRGGMGVVYKAHEESLNRFVAIKVLGEHLEADPAYVERFLREAQSAARLNHPNIVQIYAVSEDEGRHFFVMEYVSGHSLGQILRSGQPVEETRAARIVLQTAAGLQVAHQQGVIHRDIKPANLLIDDRGLVKIADFGLALMGGAVSRLTATGMFMGTPGYLSPEQCLDQGIDQRTDIYSLGVTFYEALTGRVPFAADSPLALLRQIVEVEPPDLGELNPEVDEDVRALVARMMAKDREQRHASCADLIAELRPILEARGATGALVEGLAGPPPGGASRAATDPRLDTHPTEQVASGVKASDPPPLPPATAPAAGATAQLVETSPLDESPSPNRQRRLVLLAALVVFGGIAALAAGGLVAWRSGLFEFAGQRSERSSTTVAEPTPLAADAVPTSVEETPATAEHSPDHATMTGEENFLETEPANPTPSGPSLSATVPREAESTTEAAAETTAKNSASERSEPSRPAVAPPIEAAPPAEGTVVIAFGERLFAGEAEAFLEGVLAKAGVELVDERSLPEAADLMARGEAPRPDEVRAALTPHARYLILVRVEYLGERPLQYMGQADIAFQARLTVVPIDLRQGQALASPETFRVEYTHLNAGRVAENRLRRPARRIAFMLSAD